LTDTIVYRTIGFSHNHPNPSHDRAQNDNRPYHFCAKNEYIDGQFLAGSCGSRQRQVADGADVVFTDTRLWRLCAIRRNLRFTCV